MSNEETLQEYNTNLAENNDVLDTILTMVNEMPTDGEKFYKETVLFEGEATTEDITLNDDVSNYTYIEIFFRCNSGYYNSIKIHNPNNKKAVLIIIECNNADNYFMNYKTKNVIISGNTITNQYYGEINFRLSTKSISAADRNNFIYIARVIGYK